jgi:hypothetical protein
MGDGRVLLEVDKARASPNFVPAGFPAIVYHV